MELQDEYYDGTDGGNDGLQLLVDWILERNIS